jgi:hypothetical protein
MQIMNRKIFYSCALIGCFFTSVFSAILMGRYVYATTNMQSFEKSMEARGRIEKWFNEVFKVCTGGERFVLVVQGKEKTLYRFRGINYEVFPQVLRNVDSDNGILYRADVRLAIDTINGRKTASYKQYDLEEYRWQERYSEWSTNDSNSFPRMTIEYSREKGWKTNSSYQALSQFSCTDLNNNELLGRFLDPEIQALEEENRKLRAANDQRKGQIADAQKGAVAAQNQLKLSEEERKRWAERQAAIYKEELVRTKVVNCDGVSYLATESSRGGGYYNYCVYRIDNMISNLELPKEGQYRGFSEYAGKVNLIGNYRQTCWTRVKYPRGNHDWNPQSFSQNNFTLSLEIKFKSGQWGGPENLKVITCAEASKMR